MFNFRRNLIRCLLRKRYRITVLSPEDRFSARLVSIGCEVRELPMDNKGCSPWNDFCTMRRFERLYREIQPDVALHYTIKPVIYGSLAARRLGIPVINTVTGLGTAFLGASWLTRVVEVLYRVSLQGPKRVYFQNRDDYRLFRARGLVAADIADCLPGSGVDLEHFAVSPYPERPAIRFLMIARMLRDKGVGEFVGAARMIRKEFPDIRFQLLGPIGVANRTAISGESVQGWVREGVVEYLGETEDVRPHIANADCVVLPSYREGTPRCLLEAAAMGRPLIATDVPGCREVVDDGETGLLCESRSAWDLARKMLEFRELGVNTRRRMGLLGRAKIEREFDEQRVISSYVGDIDGLLATGRS